MNGLIGVIIGSGFTLFMTALGAGTVLLFKLNENSPLQKILLGFASGIMLAAAIWSLLLPSFKEAAEQGIVSWLPPAAGIAGGGLFLLLMDKLLPHLHFGEIRSEGVTSGIRRSALLVFAVTLHNIPEGIALGIAFSLAGFEGGLSTVLSAAAALAIGIGIQNFPEGAAVSLPLRQEGMGKGKAFLYGTLSGVTEPVFGILTVLASGLVSGMLPWLLAFAAGAMIYVVVEELIPQAHEGEHSDKATISVMAGFVLMMVLDVALG